MFISIPFFHGIVDFIRDHFVSVAECADPGSDSGASGASSSEASVNPGPNERDQSIYNNERGSSPAQQRPAEPVELLFLAPPKNEDPSVPEHSEQPKQRSAAEEITLSGTKGLAQELGKEVGKCLCQGGNP